MSAPFTIEVPRRDKLTDESGLVSRTWETFFRNVRSVLDPMGLEKYAELTNNQASAADIDGMKFSREYVSQVTVDYLIQRVTTGTGATELIETGTFYVAYKPTSQDWVLSNVPSTAGVTLSITSSGQVQYTTTNITGTASISKMTYRARTLAAKNSQYSLVGGR
jgi:hypothetical protein